MNQGWETEFQDLSLGERIVQVARMAVAVHLSESASAAQSFEQRERRAVTGGAGRRRVRRIFTRRNGTVPRTRHG